MEWQIEWKAGAEDFGRKSRLQTWLGESLRQVLLFPALRLFAPARVYGLENLEEGKTYIFAANHASHADAPLVLAALPEKCRIRLRVAAAADYFFDQFWKAAAVSTVLNAFPFNRKGSQSSSSLLMARHLLDEGHSLLIFPEGTRTLDGRLQPFKRGAGWLAATSGAEVVPVYIEGACRVFPKGARWPHRQPVSITFGRPLQFGAERPAAEVAAEIERAVRTLAAEQLQIRAA